MVLAALESPCRTLGGLLSLVGGFGAAGCSSGSVASSGPRVVAAAPALPAAAGRPLAPLQRTVRMTRPVHLPAGVTQSSTAKSEARLSYAQRSLRRGTTKTVLSLAAVGKVGVSCSARPAVHLTLSRFLAGEGPPRVAAHVAATSGQTGLPLEDHQIPALEARAPQRFVFRQISGATEAFTYQATVWLLITPTRSRCDVLAQADVYTTGPFYRWAGRSRTRLVR